MTTVIWETMRMPRYSLTGFAVAFLFVSGVLIAPQWETIRAVASVDGYTFSEKITTNMSLITWSMTTQYSLAHMMVLATLALLTAVTVALSLRDVHARVAVGRMTGLGFFGALIGAFGVGCSACGAAFLTSVIGVSGATWIASRLPFHGVEFSILGICVLFATIYMLAQKLTKPVTCRVDA